MILADTSVWVDHLRAGVPELRKQLTESHVIIHPLVVAELALGSMRDRIRTLALLDLLPQIKVAKAHEVRSLIEKRQLCGLGIGIVDAHLLASVLIQPPARLWTRDKSLKRVAEDLDIHADLD